MFVLPESKFDEIVTSPKTAVIFPGQLVLAVEVLLETLPSTLELGLTDSAPSSLPGDTLAVMREVQRDQARTR